MNSIMKSGQEIIEEIVHLICNKLTDKCSCRRCIPQKRVRVLRALGIRSTRKDRQKLLEKKEKLGKFELYISIKVATSKLISPKNLNLRA